MNLVLDGYNILKKLLSNKMVSHAQRVTFIKQLQRYANHKHHAILIVFDGGPSYWPTQEHEDSVVIVYSGTKLSADDYIKQYLESHRSQNSVLVSTDRALQQWAKQYSTHVLDAEEFIHFFKQELYEGKSIKHIKGQAQKFSSEFNPELDKLMIEGSSQVRPKLEDIAKSKAQKSETLSKKEKKKQQILKKL